MNRRRWQLATGVALVFLLGGWVLSRTFSSDPEPTGANVSSCALATLPAEAADTVRLIHSDGPFPYPKSDGVVFANRQGHLPEKGRGYYHEYTVKNPNAKDRSTRRIVTGGAPLTNPTQYFYTGDHYASFCLVTGAEGP